MKLTIVHLKAGYDNAVIIEDLSLEIPEGKITALIGANGCGKSTLLKTICRIQPRLGGRVLLDGGMCMRRIQENLQNTSPSCRRTRRRPRG